MYNPINDITSPCISQEALSLVCVSDVGRVEMAPVRTCSMIHLHVDEVDPNELEDPGDDPTEDPNDDRDKETDDDQVEDQDEDQDEDPNEGSDEDQDENPNVRDLPLVTVAVIEGSV
jgi:hypothetical protein